MKRSLFFLLLCFSFVVQSGYAQEEVNLKPKTPEEWRTYLQYRRKEVLKDLYALKPETRSVIEDAEGYAVFVNFGMKILLFGTGNGRGIGVGIKDFRMVFVFEDREVLEKFTKGGWNFGTDADAALKNEEGGAATSGSIRVAPGLRVYQLTKNGLALNVMVNGTKYWVDKKVNIKD